MLRTILAVLLLAGPALAAGDAELAAAKAVHAKELAKLRDQLLADIDKVIKQTDDMGGGIDYMIRERRGFADLGVTPILPKLQPLSDKYLDAKATADKALEAAYTTAVEAAVKAGKLEDAAVLKAELKKMRDARQGVTAPPLIKITPAAGGKDTQVESKVYHAKEAYTAAVSTASKLLVDAIAEAKLKIGSATDLSDATKLARLDALAKDQEALETEGIKPKSTLLQSAVKKYDEAAGKARADFTKSLTEAAKIYLDKKDIANYEALLKEKQRFLDTLLPVNLLTLLGGPNKKLAGDYLLKGGVLSGRGTLEIPFEPGREYDLHLTLERLTNDEYIKIGIITGDTACSVSFDGWPSDGYRSGLQFIDGVTSDKNVTSKAGQFIPLKTPIEVDVSVRKDSIRVWVKKRTDKERRVVVDYSGPQDKLSLSDMKVKNEKALFFSTRDSKVNITKFEYVPVNSDGSRTKK